MVWGERGEVKHLSTRRKRYSVSSGERKRMMAKPCVCDTRQGLHARCCGAFTSSLLPRAWIVAVVDLNTLGWVTVERDSRVDGLLL